MAKSKLVSEMFLKVLKIMYSIHNSSHGYSNTSLAQTFTLTVHILTKCRTCDFTINQQETTRWTFLKAAIFTSLGKCCEYHAFTYVFYFHLPVIPLFCATSMQHGNWELKFEGPKLGGWDITHVSVSKLQSRIHSNILSVGVPKTFRLPQMYPFLFLRS
jgi:hypothetical protein